MMNIAAMIITSFLKFANVGAPSFFLLLGKRLDEKARQEVLLWAYSLDYLGVLSLITDLYYADPAGLYQYVDSTIDDVLASLSQNYSALFNNYDSHFRSKPIERKIRLHTVLEGLEIPAIYAS